MIELRMRAGMDAAVALTQVKLMASRFPGEHEMRIRVMRDGEVAATLQLGPLWMYDGSPACMAALSEFGEPSLVG